MEKILPISIFLFVLLLIAFIAWQISSAKRQQAEKKTQTLALGYQPLPKSEARHLVSRLAYLRPDIPEGKFGLKNIYQKKRLDHTLFLFDPIDILETDNNDQSQPQSLALVSSDLQLPRFVLIPHIHLDGMLGNMITKLIDKGMEDSHFNDFLQNDLMVSDDFFLSGDEPEKLENLFTDFYISRLHTNRLSIILGGKDTIMLTAYPLTLSSSYPDIKTQLYEAEIDITEIFYQLRGKTG